MLRHYLHVYASVSGITTDKEEMTLFEDDKEMEDSLRCSIPGDPGIDCEWKFYNI